MSAGTMLQAFKDKINKYDWRVEEIGPDGECYIAIFTGADAERRANEYVEWRRTA